MGSRCRAETLSRKGSDETDSDTEGEGAAVSQPCRICSQPITAQGDYFKGAHMGCAAWLLDTITPGPYQPGSIGETDESGRMVWRWKR